MKIKSLEKIYSKLFFSKYEVVAIIITAIVLLFTISYEIYANSENYIYQNELIERNYLNTVLTILNISLTFIALFLVSREANLLSDSFDVMLETSSGRLKVFIAKQIVIISSICMISLIYYLISFIPIYFVYRLFKFEFLKSYINLFIYLLEIAEFGLFIGYLIKNHFVVLIIGIILTIKNYLNISYIDYIIPGININECFYFNLNIVYVTGYILCLVIINCFLYNRMDRK